MEKTKFGRIDSLTRLCSWKAEIWYRQMVGLEMKCVLEISVHTFISIFHYKEVSFLDLFVRVRKFTL